MTNKRHNRRYRHLHRDYDSFGEYLDRVLNAPTVWPEGDCQSIVKGTGGGFYKTHSLDEAKKTAFEGWTEGRDRMGEAVEGLERMSPTPHLVKNTRRMDVCGAYPVVPHAVAGNPINMVNLGDVSIAARPIVRLAYSFSYSGMTRHDTIERWGIALLANIDRLETEGYSVEITAHHDATGHGSKDYNRYSSAIPIKRAGEPLELDRMAFCLAHPDFLRRVHFRAYEIEKGTHSCFTGSYGCPKTERPKDLDNDVYWLPGPNRLEARTDLTASAELSNQIRKGLDLPNLGDEVEAA